MRNHLLAATAISGLAFFAATPAFASCVTSDGGATYVCSSNDTNGISSAGNVTIFVDPTATVIPASGDSIAIGSGSVTVGSGAVVATSNAVAIHLTENTGAHAQSVTLNSGNADGQVFGILLESGGTVTINGASQVIGHVSPAISVGNNNATTAAVVKISNRATITGNVAAGANANDEYHVVQDTDGNLATGSIGTTITGFEKFYKDGTATTTLTGTNSQNWTVNAGTLTTASANIGNITLSGGNLATTGTFTHSGTIALTATAALNVASATTLTQSGAVTGTQDFVKTGAGTLVLTSTSNTFGRLLMQGGLVSVDNDNKLSTGAIVMNGGGMSLGNGANIDNGLTLNVAGGTFQVSTGTSTYSGVMNGTADLTKTGNGTLVLSNTNTNTGKVIVNAGTLRVTNSNNLGDHSATNIVSLNGGQLQVSGPTTIAQKIAVDANSILGIVGGNSTLSGAISGTHDITLLGSSRLTFAGTNTGYSGKIIVTSGALGATADNNLGDGSATNVLDMDGGTLQYLAAFNQSRDIVFTDWSTIDTNGFNSTLSGVISGSALIEKDGAGTLTLTGNNTYTGGLDIEGGTVVGNTDSLKGNISNYDTLVFNQAATGTYAGVLTGTGDFYKDGTGNLVMTGTSSGWNGTTIIDAGKLSVNGTLSSLTGVGTGGTLGGSGTVEDISADGKIAPGNSIGTLTATGSVDFHATSAYEVEYDNTHADRLNATGAVTITSGSQLHLIGDAGAMYAAHTGPFTILTGSSITGTFAPVINTLAFLDPTVDYSTPGSVLLSFDRNDIDFSEVAKNGTQSGAANALGDLGSGNAVFDAFTGVTSAQAATTLESLSGAGVVGTIPNAVPSFVQPVMSHIAVTNPNSSAQTTANDDPGLYNSAYMQQSGPMDRNVNAWIQAIGGVGHSLSDAQSPGQKRNNYGAVAGIDRNLDTTDGRYGVFGGWQQSEFSSDAVGASADVNSYQVGGYMQHPLAHGFTVTGGAAVMYHDIDTVRHVIVGGSDFSPHGSTNGNTLTAFGEISHALNVANIDLEGFSDLSVTRNHTSGYTETNGGAANLTVDDNTKTNPATVIGARGSKDFGIARLNGSLGWQHTFGNVDNTSDMRFAGGTTVFTSTGTPIARDAAVVGFKTNTDITDGVTAYAGYDGTLAQDAQDHSFTLGIKGQF